MGDVLVWCVEWIGMCKLFMDVKYYVRLRRHKIVLDGMCYQTRN